MRIDKLLFKYLFYVSKELISDWEIPIEKQELLLKSFNNPKDLFERSYYQYKCQKVLFRKRTFFLLTLLSLIALPSFILLALIKKRKFIKKEDAIGNFKELPEVIPVSLKEKYNINIDLWSYSFSLSFDDLLFILKIWSKYPFSAYFLFKCVMNISRFSHLICLYNPNAIIEHAEFSFTSSVQTAYCRKKGVKHIDVMHGEKRFSIRDSFFEYDSCYVWDDFYIGLFESLRCPTSQFIIEVPPSLKIDFKIDRNTYSDFKYYLFEDDIEKLKSIILSLKKIKDAGFSIKYRPHPRWCKESNLLKLLTTDEIEDPELIDIITSLSNVKYVVGFGTTVLYQAYMSHINVIMDDVTYHDKFMESKRRKYLLAEKNVPLLSEFCVISDNNYDKKNT